MEFSRPKSWSMRCVPSPGCTDGWVLGHAHLHGWPWSLAIQARRSHSAVTVQHGQHLAPRGRRTWPCRYGRRRLVTASPVRAAFGSLRLAARNRRKNTPARRHVPAGPGPATATAAETSDFPVQEREPFPFRTGCFLFLQVPCRTVAPCTACNGDEDTS
jgi:hypothetical protein